MKGIKKGSLPEIAKQKYIHYAMSVIMDRALPDVRDGLKPVQRRILYAMYHDLNLNLPTKHRKSAAITGTVLAKYHAHGESSVYDAMVRMAQPWVMRIPLVDGHGNFGSLDGDPQAASRYTEARLTKVSSHIFEDLKKPVIPYVPNYDSTSQEPVILPSSIPLLLVNGASGIAVGMATSIPPHNLTEVLDASLALLEDDNTEITAYLTAPDFPTGGYILGSKNTLRGIYERGHGTFTVRATWEALKDGRKSYIVVNSIPYGIKKQDLIEKVANVILDDELPQLVDIRDDSGKEVRLLLEIKKLEDAPLVMAYLYKNTPLESKISMNFTCLVPEGGHIRPSHITPKEAIKYFMDFRLDVIKNRCEHDLSKLTQRITLLEGFIKILPHAEEVVKIVVNAQSKKDARDQLVNTYQLLEEQASWVLDTKIYLLAKYESGELIKELKDKKSQAKKLEGILKSKDKQKQILKDELELLKKTYPTPRLTEIVYHEDEVEWNEADIIVDEKCHVIVTDQGWVKRQKSYSDLESLRVKEGDTIRDVFDTSTSQSVIFLTNKGKAYTTLAYHINETTGYGEPIQSYFNFEDGEQIEHILTGSQDSLKDEWGVFVTSKGYVSKFKLELLTKPSTKSGRTLSKDEGFVEVLDLSDDDLHLTVISKEGRVLSFHVNEINPKVDRAMIMSQKDEVVAITLSSGARGGSVKVRTSRGGIHEIRHTSHGVSKKGRIGTLVLKRDKFKGKVE